MLKTAFNAASSAGLWPYVGGALLLVAALAGGAGIWGGIRWQQGVEAVADNAALVKQQAADRKAIDELLANARDLQASAVDSALAYDQAAARMDGIATTLETTLNAHRDFTTDQRGELAALLASRPDLDQLRLGPDVLRHWNRSNAGPNGAGPAAEPAAQPAGESADPVPAAPARAERPRQASAAQPRRGRGHRQRVPGSQRLAAGGLRRMGVHRVELVLQRGGSARPARVGVPAA